MSAEVDVAGIYESALAILRATGTGDLSGATDLAKMVRDRGGSGELVCLIEAMALLVVCGIRDIAPEAQWAVLAKMEANVATIAQLAGRV